MDAVVPLPELDRDMEVYTTCTLISNFLNSHPTFLNIRQIQFDKHTS